MDQDLEIQDLGTYQEIFCKIFLLIYNPVARTQDLKSFITIVFHIIRTFSPSQATVLISIANISRCYLHIKICYRCTNGALKLLLYDP